MGNQVKNDKNSFLGENIRETGTDLTLYKNTAEKRLFSVKTVQREEERYFLQDACYPMREKSMGYAVIINNVASEFPGTEADVAALQETYETMGFTVRVESDCHGQVCVLGLCLCLLLPMLTLLTGFGF